MVTWRVTLRAATWTNASALRAPSVAITRYVPGWSATNTPAPSTVAYPCPTGDTAHSGRASPTDLRATSVATNAKRTTSPARTAVSAGATLSRTTGFGSPTRVQLSLALPAAAVIVARPAARAEEHPSGVQSPQALVCRLPLVTAAESEEDTSE